MKCSCGQTTLYGVNHNFYINNVRHHYKQCENLEKELTLVEEYEFAAEHKALTGELPDNLSQETRDQIDCDGAYFEQKVRSYAYAAAMKDVPES